MTDYFTILGLSPHFKQEDSDIKSAYFAKQRLFHPDKATSDTQRLHYVQQSADVNKAYHILKHPYSRLYYLLSLQGVDILHETAPSPTPSILMESMQWREDWQNCNSDAQKQAFKVRLEQAVDNALSSAVNALNADDKDAAVEAALRLRYLSKIKQELQ